MKNNNSKKLYASTILLLLLGVAIIPAIHSQEHQLVSISQTTFCLDRDDWWNTAWTYRKLITIDHTITAVDLSNFPFLLNLPTDADLAAYAQDDGDDITFILYTDNTTQLNHELEYFDGTTGETIAWINLPSLSASQDLRIWMYYGNSAAASQQHITDTWDPSFIAVHHLEEPTGPAIDSTSYHNDGTVYGNPNQDAPGVIDGADRFDGIDDHIILPQVYTTQTNFTLEAWFYAQPGARYILDQRSNTSQGVLIQVLGNNTLQYYLNGNSAMTPISLSTWYYVALTYDGTTAILYLNDQSQSMTCPPPTWPAEGLYIGDRSAGARPFNGTIDEVRLSTTARSIDWITTSYTNQNNSTSYSTLGTQEQVPYTNQPPQITGEIPTNGATNIGITTTQLSVIIEDPEGKPFDWTITTQPNIGGDSATDEANGTKTCSISGLAYSTTYTWTVKAYDGSLYTNKTFSFTTQAGAVISVNITKPVENTLYIQDSTAIGFPLGTIVYGPITITADAQSDAPIEKVEFIIDGKTVSTDTEAPYEYLWQPLIQFNGISLKHTIKVVATNTQGFNATDSINVTKWRFHLLPWLIAAGAIASRLVLHTKITGWVLNLEQTRFRSRCFIFSAFYKTNGPLRSARGVIKMKAMTAGPIIGPTSMTHFGFFHRLSFGSFTILGVPHLSGIFGQGLLKNLLPLRNRNS